MGFFQRAKCAAGFHQWGSWSAKSPTNCVRTRWCTVSDCQGKETETVHNWTDWASAINSCQKVRHCRDCHETGVRPTAEHQWSDKDWAFVDKETSCRQERRCPKCGEVESRLVHLWGTWQSESPLSDRLIRSCQRCGNASESRGPIPIIGVPKTSDDPDAIQGAGALMLLAVLASMKMTTLPNRKDERAVLYESRALVERGSGTRTYLQLGFKPSPVRPEYEYLAWEWDEEKEKYVVVIWSGGHWESY